MKKVLVSLAVVMMGSFVMMPNVDAQGRRGGSESSRSSQQVSSSRSGSNKDNKATRPGSSASVRPGSSNRPGSSSGIGADRGNNRPGQGSVSRPDKPGNNKPGNGNSGNNNSGNKKPNKPGNNGKPNKDFDKPGYNKPGYNKPGYNKPGNGRPSRHPGYKPGKGPRPIAVAPPPRPGRPIYTSPWVRPVPPANWRPVYRKPLLARFLGLTFGVSINSALNQLWNANYVVDGYGTDEVYLRNVNEMGYYWDDATLFFVNGGLVRSEFYDSTSYYNLSRYNNVYRTLCNNYGNPVSHNGQTVSWFGYNGDYITLQYVGMNTSSGYRYFTILTYGN